MVHSVWTESGDFVSMGRLEINCDLGEGESFEITKRIMELIDAANISCGVHAGSPETTKACIALASEFGVSVGAHPGLPLSGGRGAATLSSAEFRDLLYQQLGFFRQCCADLGVEWSHVKLHGSLYHKVEVDGDFAETYAEVLKDLAPDVWVYSLAGGRLKDCGCFDRRSLRGEVFADRSYRDDGSLTPRTEPRAVLTQDEDIMRRLKRYLINGVMETATGNTIALNADTLCVHSDTENSLKILKSIRTLFGPRQLLYGRLPE